MAEAGLVAPVLRHGNLAAKRDMSNVKDTAPVVVQLAMRGVPGEAYNVGSGQSMAISDLLALALAGARVPMTAQEETSRLRAYDEKVLLADIGKLQRLVSWKPNIDMQRTVAEILGYWRARVKQLYLRSSPGDEL
jgi:GDP-4-dehydro-6-deoxy-D-mannose reductase